VALNRTLVDAHKNLAGMLLAEGNLDEAIAWYREYPMAE
jgi:hypothetical protein